MAAQTTGACAEHWRMVRARTLELLLLFLVTCAYAVPAIGPVMLAGQLSLMATLVWRSSHTKPNAPALNTLRAVVGSLALAGGEMVVLRAYYNQPSVKDTWAARIFPISVHMTTAYAAMAISDYMFHRFIWHAHWSKTAGSFWRSVYLHYLQHYLAHHKHSLDEQAIPKMRALERDPRRPSRRAEIEASFAGQDELDALACSAHGFTVNDFCRLSTVLLQLALPSGTCIVANAMSQSGLGVGIHAALLLFPLYLVVHHDKYHCTAEVRHKWANMEARNFAERAFWNLAELDVICGRDILGSSSSARLPHIPGCGIGQRHGSERRR